MVNLLRRTPSSCFDAAVKILHVVRNLEDQRAMSTVQAHVAAGNDVTVLLMHDAVLDCVRPQGCKVLACRDDVQARGGRTNVETLGYQEMVGLVFESDRLITW